MAVEPRHRGHSVEVLLISFLSVSGSCRKKSSTKALESLEILKALLLGKNNNLPSVTTSRTVSDFQTFSFSCFRLA